MTEQRDRVCSLCGSGFQAVINAAQEIKLGESHVVLTGGVDNMSLSPCTQKPPPSPRRAVRS